MPILRRMGREIGTDHKLALQLWSSGIHEARILGSMVDDPREVSPRQMESWAKDFDSWDVCDQCCMNLFDRTTYAHRKAAEWASRKEEFVKRAGFALMASLAVHDKKASDAQFERYLPLIEQESDDNRNFVKKAVNWALRQIGKRNQRLNRAAIATAKQIQKRESRAARWIAADAIKELTSEAVREKLRRKR